jgi:hypothetical protein
VANSIAAGGYSLPPWNGLLTLTVAAIGSSAISSGWFALPRRWTLGQRPRHGDAITPISGRGGVWHRRARGNGAFPPVWPTNGKGRPRWCVQIAGVRPPPRQRKYLPILFDFEKPKSRNTDETITLLARMARFVVADKGGVPGGLPPIWSPIRWP